MTGILIPSDIVLQSRSWITPQPPSPRKLMSSIDMPSAYKDSPAQNSLKQASKIYRS